MLTTTNYMKLWVHEAKHMPTHSTHAATVIVQDKDLFRSLEICVDLLQQAGWVIDDLAEFRIIGDADEPTEPILGELISTARSEGLAYTLDAVTPDDRPPAAKAKEDGASAVGITTLLGI
jgi:hypothetical protein